MFSFLFFYFLFCNSQSIDKFLNIGDKFSIESLGYPRQAQENSNQIWNLTSPNNTYIVLDCYDLRLHQENPPGCDEDMLTTHDGQNRQEFCGIDYDFVVRSASNYLNVQLKIGNKPSGGVRCVVEIKDQSISIEIPPAIITESMSLVLEVGGTSATITSPKFPYPPPPNLKQIIFLTTNSSSAIRITCPKIHILKEDPEKCGIDVLKIIDGDNVRQLCGTIYDFSILSYSNNVTLQFETGRYGIGGFKCTVQARLMDSFGEVTTPPEITTPSYLNLESEEINSEEYGRHPGSKNTTCPCGRANKEVKRIVGGTETTINEYPFMGSLVYTGNTNSICGVSLITHRHALTAAHCVYFPVNYGYQLSVILGEHDQLEAESTKKESVPVSLIIIHEYYNYHSLKHDIAVLVLSKSVEFNEFIEPVCLSKVLLNLDGKYVRQIGWGSTIQGGPGSRFLQKVDTRVIPLNSCKARFGIINMDEPTQFCVYGKNKGACHGDSGGPVLWVDPETNRYTQVGIVSFGSICGSTEPTVKTDVSYYLGWIEKQIYGTYPSEEMCFKED